ncbi:MAG: hypothetical protein RJS97_23045 [Parvibaculaceae bacterium]
MIARSLVNLMADIVQSLTNKRRGVILDGAFFVTTTVGWSAITRLMPAPDPKQTNQFGQKVSALLAASAAKSWRLEYLIEARVLA